MSGNGNTISDAPLTAKPKFSLKFTRNIYMNPDRNISFALPAVNSTFFFNPDKMLLISNVITAANPTDVRRYPAMI